MRVLALDVYVHRLVTALGGCVATLGGLDALVFTGGVGEHSHGCPRARRARLGWFGVAIDDRERRRAEITGTAAPGAHVRGRGPSEGS